MFLNNINVNPNFIPSIQTIDRNSSTDSEKTTNNDVYSKQLLEQYMDCLNRQNRIILHPLPVITPSGIENLNNFIQRDTNGNVVQEVKFTQEGSKIIQTITVKCYDGSTMKKIITKDGDKKTMSVEFKDKDGNSLAQESRSYERIDNDTAISVHNGKQYKISGLSGDVLTVEVDNQKHIIDIAAKIDEEIRTFKETPSVEFSDELKEQLISGFKNQPGDILLAFDENIKKLAYLDIDEEDAGYVHEDKSIMTNEKVKNCTNLHELGHGVNDIGGRNWSDDDEEYIAAREIEIQNYKKTVRWNGFDWMDKFTTSEMDIMNGSTAQEAKRYAADEEFAEIFGFFNNMEIENLNPRTTRLIQYMPKSASIAYKASKNII